MKQLLASLLGSSQTFRSLLHNYCLTSGTHPFPKLCFLKIKMKITLKPVAWEHKGLEGQSGWGLRSMHTHALTVIWSEKSGYSFAPLKAVAHVPYWSLHFQCLLKSLKEALLYDTPPDVKLLATVVRMTFLDKENTYWDLSMNSEIIFLINIYIHQSS